VIRRLTWIGMGALFAIAFYAAAARAQATANVMHFKVNPAETQISATVAEPMHMVRGDATGAFRVISGEIEGDPASIASSARAKVVIDATSYQTDNQKRDLDVKQNALEVDQFPTITFESTGLSDVDANGSNGKAVLQGRLTLHGVTKDVEIPITAQLDTQKRLVADGAYSFKFEDYGVKRPTKMMIMTTGDTATINFHLVADPVQQSAGAARKPAA
jgi:polyisoprenoid-binding protein YceI